MDIEQPQKGQAGCDLGGCHLKHVEAAGQLRLWEGGNATAASISTKLLHASLWGIV
jgi:hypothetical protein